MADDDETKFIFVVNRGVAMETWNGILILYLPGR